jgi:methionyl aminopeptidase
VSIESQRDLAGLTRVGKVVGATLRVMRERLRPGLTTAELDVISAQFLARHGARSAPQLVYGFPGAVCISVNEEAVHGLPGDRILQPGDLVKLDVTAELDGYIADAAITVALPSATPVKRRLAQCAEDAFWQALHVARAGRLVREIGWVVEKETRRQRFSVLRELHGHGVGRAIHEGPTVPNYCDPQQNDRLTEGLVITIEPIITTGSGRITVDADGWTVRTADGRPSAHFEHTVVVTRDRPLIVTAA